MQLLLRAIAVSVVLLFLSSPSTLYASYTSAVAGSTATMTGDAVGDTLTINQAGGLFQHNRFTAGDTGFNSDFDFDTAVVGDQTVSSSTGIINIAAGDGNDSIVLGDGVNLRGAVDGGPGTDTLDYASYTTAVSVNLGLGTTGLSATLGADQQNPPTTHAGTGTASATNYNPATRTFDISVTVTGLLPADVNGFHIHQGPVGVDGPVIIDFTGVAPLVPAGGGFTFNATGLTVPSLSEAAFLGGGTYVNIHTAAFPGGAIRGQLFSGGNVNLTSGIATGTTGISNVENMTGGSGDDSLVGNSSVNAIIGGPGADWIVGGPGNDNLNGSAGTDVLVWSNGDGTDVDDGGTDSDTVQVNGSAASGDIFVVSANAGARLLFARTSPGPFNLDIGTVETLTVNGIGGSDTFTVNDLVGVASLTTLNLNGFDGDDVFTYVPATSGAFGFNTRGGPGADTLQGPNSASTWNVTAAGQGNIAGLVTSFRLMEFLVGGTANDIFIVSDGVNLGGAVDGGAGTDTLDYTSYTTAVSVNLGLGVTGLSATLGADQQNPPTTHAATATASATNYNPITHTFDINVTVTDLLPGDVTGFHIHQGLVGVNGPVIVDFNGIAPLVPAGGGFTFTATGLTLPSLSEAAFLGGGTYVNIHTAAFPAGAIRGQLFSTGNVNLTSGIATGTTSIANLENVTGGSGNDSLVGNSSVNIINGGSGADWIVGAPGNDFLNGGAGADVLVWSNGDGTDVDEGGTESDTVQVNGSVSGADIFAVSPNAGARLRFDRTNLGLFSLDIGAVETLIVNGIGGSDAFTVNSLAGVASLTTLNLYGFDGDDLFTFVPTSSGGFVFNAGGGPGADTLQGPNGASAWNVTAANQGNIVGLVTSFSFIESLVGGTADDIFNVKAFATGTPTVTGGGSPGSDTLSYDAELRTVSGDTTPPDGIIDSPGVQSVTFAQIETVNISNQTIPRRVGGQITTQ